MIGNINDNGTGGACFSYSEEYLNSSDARAISLNLPLQAEAFSEDNTKCFFDGLLPEGFTRRTVAQMLHSDENDYLTILAELGRECIGAVRISGECIEDEESGYEPLSYSEIKRLAEEGITRSAQLVAKTHLSLTGASGKAGLYFDSSHNSWYLPVGNAPSTHIVKQSHVRLENIVANEQLSLLTARLLGLDVPDSFILNLGNNRDEDVLFATRRFDRLFSDSSPCLNGMPIPCRLHQEDFAQALGIAPEEKYETEKRGFLGSMFTLLRKYSSDPITDQLKLWDYVIFDYLIGNTDNHIKNVSLLYSQDLSSMRLAPAYDILSTAAYESSTRDMAFFIGDNNSLDKIDRTSFEAAAKEAGLGRRLAMRRFDDLHERFEDALKAATEVLEAQGFKTIGNLRERILDLGGYAAR